MNQKLQYEIYTSYFHDLLSSTQINKNIIKKNKNINPELLYDKKWNFKDKFNIKEYRLIRKKKLYKEGFNKQNLIFDEYNLLYVNYFKKEIKSEQMLNSAIQKTRQIEGDSQINKVKNIARGDGGEDVRRGDGELRRARRGVLRRGGRRGDGEPQGKERAGRGPEGARRRGVRCVAHDGDQ